MRYLVDLPSGQVQELKQFIELGRYDSIQQFVRVAVDNQIALEREPEGEFKSPAESTASPRTKLNQDARQHGLDAMLTARAEPVPCVQEVAKRTKETIWGLYNRVFPVKIALRVLSNMAAENGAPFADLGQLRVEASQRACAIGKVLANTDEIARRQPGRKLSTALPARSAKKSILRYQDMFVGDIGWDGKPTGLPVDLGFVVIKNDGPTRNLIGLTERGAAFAKLSNPILDMPSDNCVATLSEEEADFILPHIKGWMPREWERSAAILNEIDAGGTTPERLDAAMSHASGGAKIGDAELTTERAGVLSRLTELGLVDRGRVGLKARYSLTEKGKARLVDLQKGE
jgi:hypothetical protein